jgi:hypothetical protein
VYKGILLVIITFPLPSGGNPVACRGEESALILSDKYKSFVPGDYLAFAMAYAGTAASLVHIPVAKVLGPREDVPFAFAFEYCSRHYP